MIYNSSNFDGKVIDEANYQVYSKDNTIAVYSNNTKETNLEKLVNTISMLYGLKANERCIYYNMLTTLRHFYTKGVDTRVIKLDNGFFINIEARFGINKRNAKILINRLIERNILKPIFNPNSKQYYNRVEVIDKYTPDNIIKNNVECIVIKL